MKNFFVWIFTNTIAHWNFPWVVKRFNLNHYFVLEQELDKLTDSPLAFAVVSTYGSGSNLGIKAIQWFSKDKKKKDSKATHALAIIDIRANRFRCAEAVGGGLQETSLLSAIGQRDYVKILIPDQSKMSQEVCRGALEYINRVLEVNRRTQIQYDLKHDMEDPQRTDCSELVYLAIKYGFENAGMESPIKPVMRLGNKTWAPTDVEFCDLFKVLYDSENGLHERPVPAPRVILS